MEGDKEIFLVSQLDPAEDDPGQDSLYDTGVIAVVLQLLKLPDGTVRVLVEGKQRARLDGIGQADGHMVADVTAVEEIAAEGPEARSEEHTSELQSLMRISYAFFCLQKK